MPLTGSESVLTAALRAGMLGKPALEAIDDEGLTALCEVLAEVVIPHLVANIVVNTTGTAAAQVGTIT